MVFVVDHEPGVVVVDLPDGLLDLYDAHRRLHDLPRVPRARRSRSRSSAGRASRAARRPRCTIRATRRPTCTAPVDDAPFGGGAGMVMMPGAAVRRGRSGRSRRGRCSCCRPAAAASTRRRRASWPTPGGFSLLCGRYEGVDQRVADHLLRRRAVGRRLRARGRRGGRAGRDRGRRPARARCDGQRRVGGSRSRSATGSLEYPQYTRPAEFRGWEVPEVLAVRRPRPRRPAGGGRRRCAAPWSAGPT